MNYTKGKWKAISARVIAEVEGFEPTRQEPVFVVAQCNAYTSTRTFAESEANAHLIAAAPKMYKALKTLETTAQWQRIPEYLVKDIVKILAEAEGK